MSNETGGPAFPALHWVAPQGHSANENPQGMTLRDYFAAKAMQTIIAWDEDHYNWKRYAELSYQMADEMLEARK